MWFTWLAKPSRFHMVCETMKRFTWFVKPCEIRTIKPVKFFRVLTKPCEITDPYGSLRSDDAWRLHAAGVHVWLLARAQDGGQLRKLRASYLSIRP
jgi:hypothetical protein